MPATDPGHVANVLGALSLQVSTEVAAAVEDSTGLSIVQATTLVALDNYANGRSIDEISGLVRLSHSATVRLVDRLADADLVRRRPDKRDKRVAAVHLTARGRRTAQSVRRVRGRVLEAFIGGLSTRDQAALAPLLDRLAANEVTAADATGPMSEYVCRLCDAQVCGHPAGCPVTEAANRAV